jgi:hypothetical protein
MPLLKLNDLIINTDHITQAHYSGAGSGSLVIHLTDDGGRPATQFTNAPCLGNTVRLSGSDASLMWSALSQLASPVVRAPRK